MIGLAIVSVLGLSGYFAAWLWQHYQHQQVLPLTLGLVGLGLVNCLSGLFFALANIDIGFIATAVGVISMNLGVWINEYILENPPHPNILGGRVGFSVFVVGLILLA
ncbi:MAG: hypothetical protein CUN55_11650 [Phototrophicales bacterium]|nr:MAG: hypothetical protein CUN55_11650 [Phototrophicales bacterium]